MSRPDSTFTDDRGRGVPDHGRGSGRGREGHSGAVAVTSVDSSSMGGSGGGAASTRPAGYGDDQFTDPKDHIHNPQSESLNSMVMAKEERDRPSAGPLIFETIGEDIILPVRPGFGIRGTPTNLRTNHFALNLDLEKTMYRYNVTVTDPEIPYGRKRRQFFSKIFDQVDEFRSMKHRLATDYAETLITAGKPDIGTSDTKEYRLKYHEEGELPRSNVKASRVVVSLIGPVPTSELIRYLDSLPGDSTDLENRLATIQALNIVVNATPNENPTIWQASRNVFAAFPRNDNPSTMKTYEKIDLSYGLIGLNLLELMETFSRGCSDTYTLERFIQKLRIRFRYLRSGKHEFNETVKTIHGFSHIREQVRDELGRLKSGPDGNPIVRGNADHDYGSSESITFQCSKYHPRLSVAEYFKKEHDITLKHPKATVVNFGSDTNPVWIPAELGIVEPGQPYRGKLNDIQQAKMLAIAARGPAENARRLVGAGARVIGIHADNPILSEFGVSIDTKMIVIPARVLQPPRLLYGSKKLIVPRDASWNLSGGTQFYKPQELRNWSYLTCGRSNLSDQHLQALRNQIRVCGLGIAAPLPAEGYHTDLGEADDDVTDGAFQAALQRAKTDGVKFLFVILESQSKAIHSRLKYYGDIVVGIQHTTLISKKYEAQCSKKDCGANYFADVMQKVNVKIGGINHILAPQGNPLEFLTQSPTMLVGVDVTHPAPKSMIKAPSVIGLVASFERTFTQWLGTTQLQEGRKEIVGSIGELMGERLRLFGENNNCYPKNILIYRDGVSEGQFKTVLKEEVSAIGEVCNQKYTSKKLALPKIVVIICDKRHRTRFYPTKEKDADQRHNFNPKAGTVVDRGVTSEKFHDFYIQPHAALTGTAKPCHCTVIRDDIKIGPDVLQKITHNLSYLYGRATKAVSLCPPAYYADIMCERGNKYLAKYLNKQWPPGTEFSFDRSPWIRDVHKELQDTMFYI
ncbi:MAG: hypothetical protein Q9166_005442 [cf. Caloplaca sp. 2 TL-2023]